MNITIGLLISLVFICMFLFFRVYADYRNLKEHHEVMVKLWQAFTAEVLTTYIASYFKGSPVTNYVVKLKKDGLEISIGDETNLVKVNMDRKDIVSALEEAYSAFVEARSSSSF